MRIALPLLYLKNPEAPEYEYVLDSPKELLWLLVPFFGTALLIALMKIRFKGNEGLKIS
jgi:hypothetical protein